MFQWFFQFVIDQVNGQDGIILKGGNGDIVGQNWEVDIFFSGIVVVDQVIDRKWGGVV